MIRTLLVRPPRKTSVRPNPADVRHWLSAEVLSDGQLASYLSVLRDDPNWRVTEMGGDAVRTLRLTYFPDGVPFDVPFEVTKVAPAAPAALAAEVAGAAQLADVAAPSPAGS